ncbi:MAG: hypothetical protein MUD01_23735 [Chloroflexaceae bacterium]|jgi:hypothetical protein|nr:hypothetical protein [Chloroflexaceae bacterium]
METNFLLGLNYWPRRKQNSSAPPLTWAEADSGALRAELAHIAELGCMGVRFTLRWEEFQPGPARVGSAAMRMLERALDAAQDARLQVVVTLFDVALGGAIHLPQWATGLEPGLEMALTRHFGPPLTLTTPSQPPIVYEMGYHRTPVRDLFGEAVQLEAQRYLIREVVGYFGGHPALRGWQLGQGVERARLARSPDVALEWLARHAELARTYGATQLLAESSAWALSRRDTLRPDYLSEVPATAVLATRPATPLQLSRPWSVEYVLFLHALAATLARRPVIVGDLGLATASGGQPGPVTDDYFGRLSTGYLVDEEQQARFVEEGLARLQRQGAAGVWLAAYADHQAETWPMPPLDRVVSGRTLGLVRADGSEKPAADSLRAFAARMGRGELPTPGSPPTLDLDPEAYWRQPARELARLWREWQAQ